MSLHNQKRRSTKGQSGIAKKPIKKVRAYRSLFAMNRGFEIALSSCAELKKLGLLTPGQLRHFQALAEELRAGTNHRVAEAVRDYEEQDWAHFGRLSSEDKD